MRCTAWGPVGAALSTTVIPTVLPALCADSIEQSVLVTTSDQYGPHVLNAVLGVGWLAGMQNRPSCTQATLPRHYLEGSSLRWGSSGGRTSTGAPDSLVSFESRSWCSWESSSALLAVAPVVPAAGRDA